MSAHLTSSNWSICNYACACNDYGRLRTGINSTQLTLFHLKLPAKILNRTKFTTYILHVIGHGFGIKTLIESSKDLGSTKLEGPYYMLCS